jgi:hypothetical protein
MICVGGRQSGPRVGFHGGHTITMDRNIPILVIGENEKANHDLLSAALRRRHAYICPHLNSASPELFGGRPMTAECPDYTISEIEQQKYKIPCYFFLGREFRQLRQGECVTWSQCPIPDCFTRYCLRRVRIAYHGIVLSVSRDLFGCPTHPAWQAQIDRGGGRATGEGTSQKSKTDTTMSKCSARFEKCKQECVLARYSSFMNPSSRT